MSTDWQTLIALALVALAAGLLVRSAWRSWRGEKPGCGSCSSGGCGAKPGMPSGAPALVQLGGLRPPAKQDSSHPHA